MAERDAGRSRLTPQLRMLRSELQYVRRTFCG